MNNTELIKYKDIQAYCRVGTSDSFVVKEVMGGEYSKLNIKKGDIVLDIGMNIGIFSILAAKAGAGHIFAFEPEESNYNLANKNIELNGFSDCVSSYNNAVIGNNDKQRHFSINVKKNKGAHSLIEKRGRDTITVNCKNFNDILKEFRPDVIKMDIEGGEMECLRQVNKNLLSNVREFIMEFHHAHLNDIGKEILFKETISILKECFKSVTFRENPKGAWVSNIYCSNE